MNKLRDMKEFKGTIGVYEIVEHNWSETSIMCNGKTICSFEHYVNLYFIKDEENYAINQIEYIEDRVDAGWGDIYIYELIKLTPEIKQERRKKFIDSLVSKIEKENNIKLKVESYDTL